MWSSNSAGHWGLIKYRARVYVSKRAGQVGKEKENQRENRQRWRSVWQLPAHWWDCICTCPSCSLLRIRYTLTSFHCHPQAFSSLCKKFPFTSHADHLLTWSSSLESVFPDNSQVIRVLSDRDFFLVTDWFLFLPMLSLALIESLGVSNQFLLVLS